MHSVRDRRTRLPTSDLESARLAGRRRSLVHDFGEQQLAPLVERQKRITSAASPDYVVCAPYPRRQSWRIHGANVTGSAGKVHESRNFAVLAGDTGPSSKSVGNPFGLRVVSNVEQGRGYAVVV